MFPRRIFVGGTGRSGTWILYKALGCHEAIHIFPAEMRFLIDPDGLVNLLDALTVRYSPAQSREALFRFERLMRVDLATPGRSPYAALDLPRWLGEEYYWRRLDRFCAELVELEFSGTSWDIEYINEGRLVAWARSLRSIRQRLQGHPVVPTTSTLPRDKLKVVKYFPVRSSLVRLTADLVDDLFLHAARKNGKDTWCEKTPQHLMHLDFIWELFPQSVFLHIKRDPRGVVYSLTKQHWAPDDLQGACLFLKAMCDRWLDMKNTVDLVKHCYLEIKLEDFASSPLTVLEEIASFCGIDNRFDNLPDITIEKVNYWKAAMTTSEIQLVNSVLGPRIEAMGYEA